MLLLALNTPPLYAGGHYSLGASGAQGLARAGAYVASVNDTDGQHHNPAGLSRIATWTCSVGRTVSWQVLEEGSTGIQNERRMNPVPSGGCHGPLAARPGWVVGVGVWGPAAPFLNMPDGAQSAVHDAVLLYYVAGPAVAWRAADWLSIGVGGGWSPLRAAMTLDVGVSSLASADLPTEFSIDVQSLVAFSLTAGLLVEPGERLDVGLSVWRPSRHRFDVPVLVVQNVGEFSISQRLPTVWRMGIASPLSPELTIEVAGVWEGWSRSHSLLCLEPESTTSEPECVNLYPYQDTLSMRVGVDRTITRTAHILLGMAVESSSVSEQVQEQLVLDAHLHGGPRLQISGGLGWRPEHHLMQVTLAGAYMTLMGGADEDLSHLSVTHLGAEVSVAL